MSASTDSAQSSPPSPFTLLKEDVLRVSSELRQTPHSDALRAEAAQLKQKFLESTLTIAADRRSAEDLVLCGSVVEAMVVNGWAEQPLEAGALAELVTLLDKGVAGVLAALAVAPAWQLEKAPLIEKMPYALWPAYTRCLLHLPRLLRQSGQADAMARHTILRLRELVRLGESNRGSMAVRAALESYRASENYDVLVHSAHDLRELFHLRGRLLALHEGLVREEDLFVLPRGSRRLKVGFVLGAFNDSAWCRTALPWLEALDPKRFEVIIFTQTPAQQHPLDAYLPKTAVHRCLGESAPESQSILLGELLDLCLFFTRALQGGDPVSLLASRRCAPIQLCLDEHGLGSGLPQTDLDLRTDGDLDDSAASAERIAAVPYAGISPLAVPLCKASTMEWSREGLGLAPESTLFVSMAPFQSLTPEWNDAVAKILRQVPASHLLIYSYAKEDGGDQALTETAVVLQEALQRQGVDAGRLIVSNDSFPSQAEIIALLKMADLYLDTAPYHQGEPVQLALEAGLPVLCCSTSHGRSKRNEIWLKTLGFEACVQNGWEAFILEAVRLGSDAQARTQLKDSFARALADPRHIYDPVCFSEAFGLLLEVIFDEALEKGPEQFRREKTPLSCVLGSDADTLAEEAEALLEGACFDEAAQRVQRLLGVHPTHQQGRTLHERVLCLQSRFDRLAQSLLAQIARRPADAGLWFRLSSALDGQGNRSEALNAIENSLRLDNTNLEAWLCLATFASQAGNESMLKEIVAMAKQIAPEDPRVLDLEKSC